MPKQNIAAFSAVFDSVLATFLKREKKFSLFTYKLLQVVVSLFTVSFKNRASSSSKGE
jgi:hypothetical protein